MSAVSELAVNSLFCHYFDWTKRFFSRVKKLFRFSYWPMCVTKRVFTWVKSIRKTQYLYNKSAFTML